LKDCRKYEELLARYIHGDLLLRDREILEEHLAMCPDCERLYADVTDMDHVLRELPGKEVEPPPWLASRILANLPEERETPAWHRWGRWAAGFGAVCACALAVALTLYRGAPPGGERVATAPAPGIPQPPPASSAGASPPGTRAEEPPVLRSTPGVPPKRAGERAVASAGNAKVIQQVKIFFYYPPAHKVAVTGDFNGWNIDGVPMVAAGKPGLWAAELELPPGVYSYNFIVDGEILLPDPESPNQMPDGYGGTNSLLLVKRDGAI
jgi:anti-sigma factor RsiW